jgi:hypothetical protein
MRHIFLAYNAIAIRRIQVDKQKKGPFGGLLSASNAGRVDCSWPRSTAVESIPIQCIERPQKVVQEGEERLAIRFRAQTINRSKYPQELIIAYESSTNVLDLH